MELGWISAPLDLCDGHSPTLGCLGCPGLVARGRCTLGVLTGIVLGLVRWQRSARSWISPYRGAMYWHHVSGLGVGLLVFAWILSGGLSMDHGRLFSTGVPTIEQHRRVAGTIRFAGEPRKLFSQLPLTQPVKEIEWLRVAGHPYVIARLGPDHRRIAAVHSATLAGATVFDKNVFFEVQSTLVARAQLRASEVLESFDTYYYARDHAPRPLPVLRLRYDDPASTWLHVDLTTGTLLERLDASRRAYRFWFNALHSHDLPWMLDRPVLRRTWIVILCGMGFLFSSNGVWLAWKRLRGARTLAK